MCMLSFLSPSKVYLLLHLVIIWSICLAQQLNPSTLEEVTPYCGIIMEQPFNYSNTLSGFQVICDSDQNSTLITIGRTNFTVIEISHEGYIRIMVKPTTWRCNQHAASRSFHPANTSPMQAELLADDNLDLEDTPFTYSHDRNKLTVLGCDAFVVLDNVINNGSSGCVSFCPNKERIKDGMCMGSGCCQSSIPPGLKSFNLTSYSIKNLTDASSSTGISGCTQIFVAEMDPSQFKSRYVLGEGLASGWPTVLEWAIGNKPCAIAMHEYDYACLGKNSSCYDVNPGKGYRCRCKNGFEGNPYVLDGCKGRFILR